MALFKSVTVSNDAFNISCEIKLGVENTSGFIITNIEGIDPGDTTTSVDELACMDGGYFNSTRRSSREIQITIAYEAGYEDGVWQTIEHRRHKCYKVFPLKEKIRLEFLTSDTRLAGAIIPTPVFIEGYVTNFENITFTDTEYCTITIKCPYPWFRETDLQGPMNWYTYPDPSGTAAASYWKWINNYRVGDEPCGFEITMDFTRSSDYYRHNGTGVLTITSGYYTSESIPLGPDFADNTVETGRMEIDFSRIWSITREITSLTNASRIKINTNDGQNSVKLEQYILSTGEIRATYDIIGAVTSVDVWPKISNRITKSYIKFDFGIPTTDTDAYGWHPGETFNTSAKFYPTYQGV